MRIISKLLPASKMKLVLSSIGVLALILFTSMIVFETTKAEVTITTNGEDMTVKTHKNTIKELLEEVDIVVSKHDDLSHTLDAEVKNGMQINYNAAKQITLTIDGKTNTYYTTAQTVGDFFEQEKIAISESDDISLKEEQTIEDGQNINVTKAFTVTVNDGGKELSTKTTGGTVADFLKSNQIEIKKLDKVSPELDEEVSKGTSIEIVRVKKKDEELVEEIAFDTETKEDASLEKGKEKLLVEGKKGKVLKTYEITLENGEEVSRKLIDEKVKEDKVNRVVAIGTKEPPKVATLSTNASEGANSGGKTVTMTASAFTSSCSGCSGYTATGINLKDNPNKKVIAVDPSVIPLGSKVWVEGYGEAVAGDTGGHIKGSRIDVHVPNKSSAYNWGVRKVKVKILD